MIRSKGIPAVTNKVGGNQILLHIANDTLEWALRSSPVKQ